MIRRKSGRIDGILLALLIVALVIVAVVTVGGRFWWLPPLASEHGKAIDTLFIVTLAITGAVFVLVQLLLAFLVFRYAGSEKRRAIHFTDNKTLEVVWTVVPAVILTALIVSGGRLWSRIQISEPPEDAFKVEVWGEQFRWTFRYPGKDGKFGRTDPKLISVENPLGIDKNDPAAKDDIFFFAGEENLHVPVNKPIVVYLRAKDVLHSFYVPQLRVKQDLVPGMVTRTWFVVTKKGEYEIACAELCGLGHYGMRGVMVVEDEKDVQNWLKDQLTVADVLP
ncbi:MAG: cytochrome c oxidase subunit II [Armatimonadetes bacterium]|nr:cytochrome c oxidase subunit II [Armatimonadota bacterium]MDW8029626.1 cytochrome c oxidase subunit II [Armatimonadota bacterium]